MAKMWGGTCQQFSHVIRFTWASFGNTENMAKEVKQIFANVDLVPPLSKVDLDGGGRVDGEPLVRVDGHAEETRVGVDQFAHVSWKGCDSKIYLASRSVSFVRTTSLFCIKFSTWLWDCEEHWPRWDRWDCSCPRIARTLAGSPCRESGWNQGANLYLLPPAGLDPSSISSSLHLLSLPPGWLSSFCDN